MSSRNLRLTPEQRSHAPGIYRILRDGIADVGDVNPAGMKARLMEQLAAIPGMKPEYVEIADAVTLQPVSIWQEGQELIVCVAVWMGEIRLIDNIRFIRTFAA